MTIMPETASPPRDTPLFDLTREARFASAAEAIRDHCDRRAKTTAALDAEERRLIAEALAVGFSKSRIAELFELRSRTRIDRIIADLAAGTGSQASGDATTADAAG